MRIFGRKNKLLKQLLQQQQQALSAAQAAPAVEPAPAMTVKTIPAAEPEPAATVQAEEPKPKLQDEAVEQAELQEYINSEPTEVIPLEQGQDVTSIAPGPLDEEIIEIVTVSEEVVPSEAGVEAYMKDVSDTGRPKLSESEDTLEEATDSEPIPTEHIPDGSSASTEVRHISDNVYDSEGNVPSDDN